MLIKEAFRVKIISLLEIDDIEQLSQLLERLPYLSAMLHAKDSFGLSLADAMCLFNAQRCAALMKFDCTSHRLPSVAELSNTLRCEICHETFLSPLLSWCGHAFCRSCVACLMMTTANTGYNLLCPICRGDLAFPNGYRPDAWLSKACATIQMLPSTNVVCKDTHLDIELELFARITREVVPSPMFMSLAHDIFVFVKSSWIQFTLKPVLGNAYRLFITFVVTSPGLMENIRTWRFNEIVRTLESIVVLCMYQCSSVVVMEECFSEFVNMIE